MEAVITGVFEDFAKGKPVTKKWPRIPFAESLRKYGTDKPDLRNPIVMQDVSEHFRGAGFKLFARLLEDPKNRIWAIPAPKGGQRTFADRMNSWAQSEGQPGLGYMLFFDRALDEKKVDFSHTPFSMPQGGLEALQTQDPLTIKAFQYDIACNGFEIASGGIRNHRPEAMVKAFEIAGYGEDAVIERFGGMYRAFQYGAPPHGGMAAGVDRIIMLLAGEQNLREVALFPMNQRAEELLIGEPSPPTPN